MVNTFFICFNGPPRCGKTSMAKWMVKHLRDTHNLSVKKDSFAQPMKTFVGALLGNRYDRLNKDEPHPALGMTTPRDLLIGFSEDYMKRIFGFEIWAETLYARHTYARPTIVVVDDMGFEIEQEVLPVERTYIVHMSRPDCNFENDSRDYVSTCNYIIQNTGTLLELYNKVPDVVDHALIKFGIGKP